MIGSLSFSRSNSTVATAARGCTALRFALALSCNAERSILSKASSQSLPNHTGCASKRSERLGSQVRLGTRPLPAPSAMERRTSRKCDSPQSDNSRCSVEAAHCFQSRASLATAARRFDSYSKFGADVGDIGHSAPQQKQLDMSRSAKAPRRRGQKDHMIKVG